MNHNDLPLNEDFYIGEDSNNLPKLEEDKSNEDYGAPLPDKYVNKLPEYFKIFCKPYISKNGGVKFDIELGDEFYKALKIHYGMKKNPTKEELCNILESEIKNSLKDF